MSTSRTSSGISSGTSSGISRRQALSGAAVVGIGVPVLAACGSSDSAGDTASDGGGDTPAAGAALGSTADVPVGGGTIFADEKIVVTQPTEGDFKGFSSICTHQGCPVSSVEGGTINCTCHGSKFSVEDGSVVNGPATSALAAVSITVEGDEITTS